MAQATHSNAGSSGNAQGASGPSWFVAPLVALAAFMEVMDISIANVSLEHIAGNLSATKEEATWVLTSYLVTNAIVLPMSGWLSGIMGRKRFFLTCIIAFSIFSLLCGFAPSLGMLVIFRALQGAAGGGLQPTSQAMLADYYPPSQRGRAFAFYGVAVVFAPTLGPTLGGWITQHMSWRWVFFINVPVGALLVFLILTALPETAQRRSGNAKPGRIDYLGFTFLALGMGALQIVLDRGQRDDWFASHFIMALALMSVLGFVALIVWELRHEAPIVDLRLFHNRSFAIANVLMFVLGFALLGSTELIPQFVQSLLGFTTTDAGLVIMPGGFVTMLLMPIVGRLTDKFDPRWLIVYGFSIGALALYHMSGFNTQSGFWTVALARMMLASGLPFLFLPITTAGYVGVASDKNDEASALINMSRNVGGSVGISILTTILARRSQYHQSVLTGHVTPFSSAYHHLSHVLQAAGAPMQQGAAVIYQMVQQQARMLAYADDFWFLAVMFIAMVPLALLVRRAASHTEAVAESAG